MFRFLTVATCVGFSSFGLPNAVQAATLTYTGATYDHVDYSIKPIEHIHNPENLVGTFETSMAISFSVELTGTLEKSTVYTFAADGKLVPFIGNGTTTIGMSNWSVSDGLSPHAFEAGGDLNFGHGKIVTGYDGRIVDWGFHFEGFGASISDPHFITGSYTDGDSTSYGNDYSFFDPSTGHYGVDNEVSHGTTFSAGVWSGTAIAPVPLPASGLFLVAGLAGLGTMRRKARG